MEARARFNQTWWKWSLIAAGWTLFGVFFASELVVNRAYDGWPLKIGAALAMWLICSYLWLAATPLILYLAHRFPLERRVWLKNSLIHLAIGSVLSIVLLSIYVVIASWVGLIPPRPFTELLRRQIVGSGHAEILTYLSVVGLTHALDYYRKYREREVKASQLEAQLARAQLDALRMQLHPHFLFNTLNTISVLMNEDVALANRLLLRLSDLLRVVLKNTESHEVSLREELEFLRSYLEIEQTRFQDRLTVRFDIDDRAFDAQVPKLILQPLVENAIRYAVAPRAGKSMLQIRAARLNGEVELRVSDDGPGISEAALTTNGIGLSNTRARLEKLYGTEHSFYLSPAAGGGQDVTIKLPFHTGHAHEEKSHGEDPRTAR